VLEPGFGPEGGVERTGFTVDFAINYTAAESNPHSPGRMAGGIKERSGHDDRAAGEVQFACGLENQVNGHV
jgi:hypothetical protein